MQPMAGRTVLKDTSVTANALHPGVVSTSFGADDPPPSAATTRPLPPGSGR